MQIYRHDENHETMSINAIQLSYKYCSSLFGYLVRYSFVPNLGLQSFLNSVTRIATSSPFVQELHVLYYSQ